MSAEVFDVHLLVDEVSEEVGAAPDEGRGEQAEELHDLVRGALVVEDLQQAGHRAILLHQLHHAVELDAPGRQTRGPRSRGLPATCFCIFFKSSS